MIECLFLAAVGAVGTIATVGAAVLQHQLLIAAPGKLAEARREVWSASINRTDG